MSERSTLANPRMPTRAQLRAAVRKDFVKAEWPRMYELVDLLIAARKRGDVDARGNVIFGAAA